MVYWVYMFIMVLIIPVIMIVFGLTAGTYFNLRIFAIYMLMFLPMLANNREGIEA